MSIAEKLTTIAENEQKVYNAGYEKGKSEGGTGGTDYLSYSTSARFPNLNLFGKKEVEVDMPLVKNFNGIFNQSVPNTTVEHLTINGALDGTITEASMFCYSGVNEATLKRLTLNCDFSKTTTLVYAFYYLSALEVIDGIPIDFSSATNIKSLHSCPLGSSLREMRVAPLSIKVNIDLPYDGKLSDETIQSIIDGLADLTDGTAKTLTLHSTVGAKLTDEQKATITAKNWTLVY